MVTESALKSLEMKYKPCRMLNSSYRIYLWQIIAFQVLVIFTLFILFSLTTPEKPKVQFQTEIITDDVKHIEKSMKWMELPNKMENLNENPVYAQFNISRKEKPSKVNLLIIVSSAPKRYDRRLAIRETWWQQCRSNKRVSDHLFYCYAK